VLSEIIAVFILCEVLRKPVSLRNRVSGCYCRKEAEPPEGRSQAEPGNEGLFFFSLSLCAGKALGVGFPSLQKRARQVIAVCI
jgi:hypothetical protein